MSSETELPARLTELRLDQMDESAHSDVTLTTDADGVISLDLGTSSGSYDGAPVTEESGSNELEKFRKEWEAEVKARRGGVSVGPVRWKSQGLSRATPAVVGPGDLKGKNAMDEQKDRPESSRPAQRRKSQDQDERPSTTGESLLESSARLTSPVRTKNEDAVTVYARAVENEQTGQLSEALQLYRKAFKMNDNVDRLYARTRLKATPEVDPTPTSTDVVSPSAPVDAPYSFQRHIQLAPDYEASQQSPSLPISPLAALFRSHPGVEEMPFSPLEEHLPVPIEALPPELLESIFRHLDVLSLERFGSVSWKARYLSARSETWKTLARTLYRRPAIVTKSWARGRTEEDVLAELGRRHAGEWRSVMLEEERVRMDGCYIAVCHYVRPGAGDQWVTVTHMITYHRFLRFYPDGTVISFLTTNHPAEVVPVLKPTLRGKGLHIGQWHLVRSDARPPPPAEPGSPKKKDPEQPRPMIVVTGLLEPSSEPKYEFEMDLDLRETGRGRWNKLDIQSYRSINLSNGEVLGLALKHQRPFYFSKVRSYHPPL